MEEKKLLMIVNPRSGRNRPRGPLFDACRVFTQAGYLLSIRDTEGRGDAARIAEEYGGAFDAVAAVGGDGTLNECVTGLLRLPNPPPLGYLPRGSTNDFAASLHLSQEPPEAAAAMLRAQPRKLDVGTWNERNFIYVASFGAFTRSSYAASQTAKNALGYFAYILEGLRDLDTLRPYPVRLTADGETLDGEYLFGAVSNSTSIGGLMKLEPDRVVLDDGQFELLLIPNPKKISELNDLVVNLLNQKYDGGGLIFRHVSSLRLETDADIPWSLDGEYAPSAPVVEIVNHPRAVTMLL